MYRGDANILEEEFNEKIGLRFIIRGVGLESTNKPKEI